MQPRPPGISEFLVLALVGVGVVLLLAMTVGKIVSLLWAAAVPLAAYLIGIGVSSVRPLFPDLP